MNFLVEKIKNTPITIGQWVLSFTTIVLIRFFLESLSSPTATGIIPSDAYTLIHYGLFWITLTLGLIIIIGFFTKNFVLAAKAALFGLPVIWSAPLFDILISRGAGYTQSYIFDSGKQLLFDFLTFFGPHFTSGVTYGMRMEMAFVLVGIGWYVFTINKKFFQSLGAALSAYVFGFIVVSLPAIMYMFSHPSGQGGTLSEIYVYFEKIIFQSTLSHNTLHEGLLSVSHARFFELGFDKLFSQILFIISFFLVGILFWKIDKKKFLVIIKNSRPERIGSYISLLLCGAGFAYINKLGSPFVWTDALGLICLIISWFSLWMHAVHVNDIVDVEIDTISNPERPLIQKGVNENIMRETGYLWLALALLGSWCTGFYPFFMSLVYVASYYIYSSPPLRLRQFPLIPSFLIGVAGLSTILSGFFFISANKEIQTFPMLLSVGIIVMITLAINVKDMKDIAGDKKSGIVTLPILFGKNGARVVGLCFALSFLLVPIFLSFYFLYIVSVPAAITGYKLVTKKPYHEEPIFILRFAFLISVALLYIGIYSFAHTYLL